MRLAISTAALGALFGAAAALLVTGLRSRHQPAEPPQSGPAQIPIAHVPSAWDPRFLSRLSGMEARLGALEQHAPAEKPAEPAPADQQRAADPIAARAAEVEQQYVADLEYQAKRLSDHDQEPVDEPWARAQAEVISKAFNAAVSVEHPLTVSRVDCKKATCVAELVYPSANDALADRDVLRRAPVAGCHELSSALTPPSGPGAYTTTVIYNCR